jgi:hypothetical protein
MSRRWKFRPARGPVGSFERDWQLAKPPAIARALARAAARPSGGWYVLDASRRITDRPRAFVVEGRELVAWRADDRLLVAPNACPHMGAALSEGKVCRGHLVCPWHGLRLGADGHGGWQPLPAFDDGVLGWVRLGPESDALAAPVLPPRPRHFLDGVVRIEARCDPPDVIANRLDPWHGAHFHPYSFAALEVIDQTEEVLTVRVEKRILGPIRVEVDATFHSPEPRTIVMTIIAGEGAGSVVETHATPMTPGRAAIVEATLATSDRPGFRHLLRLAGFIRPFIERSARRLWVDDAAYAERLYHLRTMGTAPATRPGGDYRHDTRSASVSVGIDHR